MLKRLQVAGLGFDSDKHKFSAKKTKKLGLIISSEIVTSSKKMDSEKVTVLSDWQALALAATKTARGDRCKGFPKLYQSVARGYSKIRASLTALTGNGTPWM